MRPLSAPSGNEAKGTAGKAADEACLGRHVQMQQTGQDIAQAKGETFTPIPWPAVAWGA